MRSASMAVPEEIRSIIPLASGVINGAMNGAMNGDHVGRQMSDGNARQAKFWC
jgi:hypothetical protein